MNISNESRDILSRIEFLQRQLSELGPMRPGCLSIQYSKPREKKGAYYQLSYTHRMRSRTEYIPAELVPIIKEEVSEYRRYRKLIAEWVDLSLQLSRLKISQWKQLRKSS